VDASGAEDFSHSEGTLPAGGELVHSLMGKNAQEHQIVHLEMPTTHESLVTAPECLTVSCVLKSCLPSLLIDEVDIITLELVLHSFIICLYTGGDHGDFWGDNNLCPVHQEKRRLPHGLS
jgi:hypothetical protein